MAYLFGCSVGLSDHTLGIGVSVASVSFGVKCIEKHFTLSRADGGVDSSFSMEPHEFALLVTEVNRAYDAVGDIFYGLESEEGNVSVGKRSIYAAKNIEMGEMMTADNIKVIRPGFGLHPRYYQNLVGKNAKRFIASGEALNLSDINE